MRSRFLAGIGGLLLLVLAFWQTGLPAGLERLQGRVNDIPYEFIAQTGHLDGSRPLVLIGHGYAGSAVIMRGFAYTLAQAGYVAALWDFDGHGANSNPLPSGLPRNRLLSNAEAVWGEAQGLGIGDGSRTAILGHSMGSGVALEFGVRYPQARATIAVSPVLSPVTLDLPQNLLLMAGQNEPGFQKNARILFEQATGQSASPLSSSTINLVTGNVRRLIIVPWVEHVSIVFSPFAHHAARQWLDAVIGRQPGALDYTDTRILWYVIGLTGMLLACLCLVPGTRPALLAAQFSRGRRFLALTGAAISATLLLQLLDRLGLDLSGFLGLQMGGYLLVWFAIAGLLALALLYNRAEPGGTQPWSWLRLPSWSAVWPGLLVAAFLWVGMGLLGGQVWLPWLLIPVRLRLLPLAFACLLPWSLAVGQVTSPAHPLGRAGWWLAHSLILLISLFFAIELNPQLRFLGLILPLFPIILAVQAIAAGRQRHFWAYAFSAAPFLAWVILAVFPLSG